ncbi:MAG: hypothetical protein ACLP59_06360 [Bryobacteraceae bacterium]
MSEGRKHRHDWSQTRTLYVVLQGEFVLYRKKAPDNETDDTLRILAPLLPEHRYLAGPWLTDWKNAEELPRRLCLRNAIGDHKDKGTGQHSPRSIPENNTDIIMALGEEAPQPQHARLEIEAPLPLAILSGAIEATDKSVVITVFEPDGGMRYPPVPKYPSVISILVYKWYADHRPYFFNEEYDIEECRRRWTSGGPSDQFQSLNIYASADNSGWETAIHAKQAFHAASHLLGVDAEIDWTSASFRRIPVTPPAGLSWVQINWFLDEIFYLNPCNPLLTLDNLDLSDETIEWPPDFDKDALTAGPSTNCGPITGGGSGH